MKIIFMVALCLSLISSACKKKVDSQRYDLRQADTTSNVNDSKKEGTLDTNVIFADGNRINFLVYYQSYSPQALVYNASYCRIVVSNSDSVIDETYEPAELEYTIRFGRDTIFFKEAGKLPITFNATDTLVSLREYYFTSQNGHTKYSDSHYLTPKSRFPIDSVKKILATYKEYLNEYLSLSGRTDKKIMARRDSLRVILYGHMYSLFICALTDDPEAVDAFTQFDDHLSVQDGIAEEMGMYTALYYSAKPRKSFAPS